MIHAPRNDFEAGIKRKLPANLERKAKAIAASREPNPPLEQSCMTMPISEWESSDKRPPGRKKFFHPIGDAYDRIDWRS